MVPTAPTGVHNRRVVEDGRWAAARQPPAERSRAPAVRNALIHLAEGGQSHAPEVGLILDRSGSRAGTTTSSQLANLTKLIAGGLAEMSAEVFRLEIHARNAEPDIFGRSPKTIRAR